LWILIVAEATLISLENPSFFTIIVPHCDGLSIQIPELSELKFAKKRKWSGR